MKILLTACPSHGHLFLPVPLGWALRNAGHDVLYALPEGFLDAGNATGLPTARLTDVRMHEVMARTFAPLLEKGFADADPAERGRYAVLAFTRLAEAVADDMVELARAWRPDLVVSGAVEFAGPLAARVVGAAQAHYGWGTWLGGPAAAGMNHSLAELYARHGAEVDVTASLVRVETCPPSIAEPGGPPVEQTRYVPYNGVSTLPAWLLEPKQRPRVCVTLGGSVGGGDNPAGAPLLRSVLEAVDGGGFETVVALGDLDVAGLGTLPDHVRVERWLPLNQVLPTCDAVVHHAGAGTTMTAGVLGLPQLAMPQVADAFRFADRLHETGAGIRLLPHQARTGAIRDAVSALLDDPAHREAAAGLQKETVSLPGPAHVVPLLEEAARKATPEGAR